MSEEELSVYLFKSPDCVPCEFILKSLRKIVESSALKAKIQVIDTHVNQELAERFNVRNVPHVLVAGAVILTAQQASGIISGSVNSWVYVKVPCPYMPEKRGLKPVLVQYPFLLLVKTGYHVRRNA